MKKLSIISMIIMLILAVSVFAVGDLSIIDETTAVSTNTGASAVGGFKLDNTGASNLSDITLTSSIFSGTSGMHNISSALVSFIPSFSRAVLTTTETPEYNYSISVQSDVYADTYTGTITARDAAANTDNFVSTLTVNPRYSLVADNPTLTIVQGMQGLVNMTFTNDGNKEVDVDVFAENAIGTSSNIDKTQILVYAVGSVDYKETKKSEIKVTVPEAQTPGPYNSNLIVTYNGVNAFNKTLSIIVEAKNNDITLTTPSIAWAKGLSTSETAKVTVKNVGNLDLSGVLLSASNLASGANTISLSSVSFSENNFALAKNAQKEVTVTLSGISSTQAVGTYTGLITAEYVGKSETTSLTTVVREPSKTLSLPASVDLGSSTSARNATYTKQFSITNNGDYAFSNLVISTTSDAKYLVKFSLDGTNYAQTLTLPSIAKAEVKQLYVSAYAPETMSSGSIDIGDITFADSDNFTASITPFTLSTKGYLGINEAKIYIDGEDESLDNGDLIDEIKPGSVMKIELDIENMFSDSVDSEKDMTIETDKINLQSTKDLGDDTIDEDAVDDSFKIEPGDEETAVIDFTIPENTDEGTYNFNLVIEGIDDDDSKHKITWSFQLKVEKEDHMIQISRAELDQSTVSCSSDSYLSITIRNLGQDDEDEVRLQVTSTDLGISIDNRDIELSNNVDDDDNEYTYSVPIDITSKTKPGTYKIKVQTLYDDTKKSEAKDVSLTVAACTDSSSTSTSTGTKPGTTTGSIIVETPTSSGTGSTSGSTSSTATPPVKITETSSIDFRDSDWYFVVLLGALAVVIAAIIVVVMKGFPAKYKY